jgi:hypothetical protein
MATVGKKIADQIKDADGYYSDDPRVMRIVEYTNMAGVLAYGIEYGHEIGRYAESEFIRNPRVYWEAK